MFEDRYDREEITIRKCHAELGNQRRNQKAVKTIERSKKVSEKIPNTKRGP